MHTQRLDWWQHEHVFGQDQVKSGERRTLLVVLLTAVMMVVEIAAGLAFGSMALLADGLHMASHATALGISVFAYVYARRLAGHPRYSFGTGKVNGLAGFASAVLLVIFAAAMAWESAARLIDPIPIALDQALVVATAGLLVNGASAWILAAPGHRDHGHHHDHVHHGHRHDHNLRAAYLHVLADALTSLLAIFALLAAKLFAATWLDPVMGVVGAALVTRWSMGLLRETSRRAARRAGRGRGDRAAARGDRGARGAIASPIFTSGASDRISRPRRSSWSATSRSHPTTTAG